MKHYIGDKGKTGLFGVGEIDKDSPRIEAIGAIDELNSFIGFARSRIKDDDIKEILEKIQRGLFSIGSDLAAPHDTENIMRVIAKDVEEIEAIIEDVNEDLNKLTGFILPSGSVDSSLIQICRTVCRRAERRLVTLKKHEDINRIILVYVNRLSDLFFSLARLLNKRAGIDDEYLKD